MSFVDQVLEFDRARAAGRDAPVPATGGRRVVCVVCPETADGVAARLGLDRDQVMVVAVPAARVHRADGDVARAVALAAGACGGSTGGADVVVIGHEGCTFRSPTFAVPGPQPPGESFATPRDLVRHSVAQLRASAWTARTVVSGLVIEPSGRIEGVGDVPAAAGAPGASLGPALGPAAFGAPGPIGSLAATGPVSFFGGSGVAGPSLASAPPLQSGAVHWESPPPIAAGGTRWDAPPPISSTTSMPGVTAMPSGARTAQGARMPDVMQMPTVGPLPEVTAQIPSVTAVPEMAAFRFDAPTPPARASVQPMLDTPPPPKAAPPKPAQPHPTHHVTDRRTSSHGTAQREHREPAEHREPPATTQPPQGGDDPFKRAEEILERLRREKRR